MECNRQSHLKSNSANQCAIIRGFALRLTLSWGKQTAPHGIKTSIKSCGVENFSTNYTCSKILVQLNLKRTQDFLQPKKELHNDTASSYEYSCCFQLAEIE
ncbi:hypothetical protein T03_13491 [Trichinella britovi]|uniref:Uncharacterized protein n=1 Tax=Trichinella britovi TaxID=45882 RepID=A0A0V1D8K2_TRIBR|nr:hypothetical protein T03_13491 [Trichinella britovi]